jgi:DnaJ like chaperone protein
MGSTGMSGSEGMWQHLKNTVGGMFGVSGLTSDGKVEVEVLFGMIGFLAKSDGLITSYESDFAAKLQDDMHLNTAAVEIARAAFDRGRASGFDVESEAHRFLALHKQGSEQFDRMFDALLGLSLSDDRVYPRERQALERVATAFGVSIKLLDQRMNNLKRM